MGKKVIDLPVELQALFEKESRRQGQSLDINKKEDWDVDYHLNWASSQNPPIRGFWQTVNNGTLVDAKKMFDWDVWYRNEFGPNVAEVMAELDATLAKL